MSNCIRKIKRQRAKFLGLHPRDYKSVDQYFRMMDKAILTPMAQQTLGSDGVVGVVCDEMPIFDKTSISEESLIAEG